MRISYKYGVGYGRHEDDLEVDDNTSDEEIEGLVREAVLERLDWSWRKDN